MPVIKIGPMRKLLYFCQLYLMLVGCGHYNNVEYSADFYLIYKDEINEIDLLNNTFTRNYIGIDSTIILNLTESERRKLFDVMKDNSIWTVDNNDLKAGCPTLHLPSGDLKLEVSLEKGKKFEFAWTSNNCHASVDKLSQVNE
jgi:hypothetical protein